MQLKHLRHLLALFLAVSMTLEGVATAQGGTILAQRCEEDSLSIPQAVGRIDWSIHCGYLLPGQRPFLMGFNDGTADAGRPLYPIFTTPPPTMTVWVAPTDPAAPCNRPADRTMINYCTASCYSPEQLVLFMSGYDAIKDAHDRTLQDIVTLDASSTLDDLRFTTQKVDAYTASLHDVDHLMYDIRTASGGTLRVTENHLLVLGDGTVQQAAKLTTADALVRADGSHDPVASIATSHYFGKVYNVAPESRDRIPNLIVAQGFVTGSNRFQNWMIDDLHRQVLRANLPAAMVE